MIDFEIRPSGQPVPDAEREAILRGNTAVLFS